MTRCLISFDLDVASLKQHYPDPIGWHQSRADINKIMTANHFTRIQGAVYLGDKGIRQAHAALAIQEVVAKLDWVDKCISNVQIYTVTDLCDAQFIVDDVARARTTYELETTYNNGPV